MAHDPLRPIPDKPEKPADIKLLEELLLENESHAREIIRHSKWIIQNHEKHMAEAEEAIRRAIAKRDALLREYERAPMLIAKCEETIRLINKKLHRIKVQPKIDKIKKLQAKIAELEGKQ